MCSADAFGFWFIRESTEDVITNDDILKKADELLDEAKEKYHAWLDSRGLCQEMGVVFRKEEILP